MLSKIKLADRTLTPKDPIDALFAKIDKINAARALEGKKPIISLGVGTPQNSLLKTCHELSKPDPNLDYYGYSLAKGKDETLTAILKLYHHYYPHANYTIDEVMLTNGATQGIWNALSLLLNPNDVVLLFEPYYCTYAVDIARLGGKLVKIPTEQYGFRPNTKALQQALECHPQAKVIIYNYPNNPTGIDMTKEEYQEHIAVLQNYPIAIIHDNVYRDLASDNHVTFVDVEPSFKDRCIMINSVSKGLLGAPSARLGMIGANSHWINEMMEIQGTTIGCMSHQQETLLSNAIEKKVSNNQEYLNWIANCKLLYKENMSFLKHELNQLGMKPVNSSSGFFVYADASCLIRSGKFKTDDEITDFFLTKAGVFIIPGSCFGQSPTAGYLRFSCAVSKERLELGWNAIKQCIEQNTLLPSTNVRAIQHFSAITAKNPTRCDSDEMEFKARPAT